MMYAPEMTKNVLSTTALVMSVWLDAIRLEIPSMKFVYDDGLSYETALIKLRADNNFNQAGTDFYPLFIFRRSVLKYEKDGIGARSVTMRQRQKISDGTSRTYHSIHGHFDVEFLVVFKNMESYERFEVAYLAEEAVSNIKSLPVDLTNEINETFDYYAEYVEPSDKSIQSGDHYFKALRCATRFYGWYPVFTGEGKHIEQIIFKIKNFYGGVLSERIIT